MNLKFPSYEIISEPLLSFHFDRVEDNSIHPLIGLKKFGPYSKSTVGDVYDPIRIAVIVPFGTRGVIKNLFRELRNAHEPRERKQYLIDYPGFKNIFGVNFAVGPPNTLIELPSQLDQRLNSNEKPHLCLAEALSNALAVLNRQKSQFDVVLIYLPERWRHCFVYKNEGHEEFDLHDYLKAITAQFGIPSQILLEDSALNYHCRASVMWRLSIALYTKAGGVPWKLANISPSTAFIGISYSLKNDGDKNRFITCCSQVFDSDGSGLEFLTYETQNVNMHYRNPFLNRNDMGNLMSRSLNLYQKRHNGQLPRRVVVHKSTD
ncbi:MAG: Piwi domain-containing protein, partial [Candidatus Paceibacterota bacterium]